MLVYDCADKEIMKDRGEPVACSDFASYGLSLTSILDWLRQGLHIPSWTRMYGATTRGRWWGSVDGCEMSPGSCVHPLICCRSDRPDGSSPHFGPFSTGLLLPSSLPSRRGLMAVKMIKITLLRYRVVCQVNAPVIGS